MTAAPEMRTSGSAGGMRRSPLRAHAATEIVPAFCRLVDEEIELRRRAGPVADPLLRYLRFLFGPDGRLLPVAIRAYADRLRPILSIILGEPPGLRVLDAGCGFGTESLLFALLGCDVTGVELVPERVELARSRLDFFASRAGGPFSARFVNANILRYIRSAGPVDVIWAMESVSHIHPLDPFLAGARDALRPGGRLAVSDPNALSPVAWLRAVRIRGAIRHRPHRRFLDPETGAPVDYAQEKIVSPGRMARLFARHGFRTESVTVSGYFATTILPRSWLARPAAGAALGAFQSIVRRIPGLRRGGAHYTIVGRKDDDAQPDPAS